MHLGSPKLSVLLPAYNAAAYIHVAIESILNQTFTDFELLIADDGSTDNTRHIVDSFSDSRIILHHNSSNLGKTATVNRLFKMARGEYITVHDADDISCCERFKKQIELLTNCNDVNVCGTSFWTIDKNGDIIEENSMPTSYEEILHGIDLQSQFHGPTMMIRHSSIRHFPEFYRPYFRDNYEDTDLAYRIIETGKGINLKDYLYIYRILDTSLCRRDVNVRNRNLYSVVSYLAKQRKTTGLDVLMQGKPELADAFLEQITTKYKNDPSLIYREAASYYFYWKLNEKALQAAWTGLKRRPFHLINLRTYLYIIRQQLTNLLRGDQRPKKHYKEVLRDCTGIGSAIQR